LTFRSIAGGVEHQCGILKTDDSVVCWGLNDEGQLGNGTTVNSSVPLRVAPPANP
jgi:alpha-tubulin suppressor-like RCC1 family protein